MHDRFPSPEVCFALRRRSIGPLLAAALLGSSCSSLGGGPRTLTLSEADLARWAQTQFPMERRVLEVVDLTLSSPRIGLRPDSNRLAAEVDLSGKDRLFGRPFTGKLALDGSLRYDAAGQAVRLDDVKVQRLEFEGLPGHLQSAARGLGPVLVEQLFENRAVYRFKPEDLQKAAAAGLQPQAVRITALGVELTLAATSSVPLVNSPNRQPPAPK